MVPQLKEKEVSFNVQTAADKGYISFPNGATILEVGVCGFGTDAGGATIKFDSVVNGAARGDGDLGVITVPAESIYGKMLREDSAVDTELVPGSGCIVEVTAEGVTSLPVTAFVRYIDHGTYVASASTASEG